MICIDTERKEEYRSGGSVIVNRHGMGTGCTGHSTLDECSTHFFVDAAAPTIASILVPRGSSEHRTRGTGVEVTNRRPRLWREQQDATSDIRFIGVLDRMEYFTLGWHLLLDTTTTDRYRRLPRHSPAILPIQLSRHAVTFNV